MNTNPIYNINGYTLHLESNTVAPLLTPRA